MQSFPKITLRAARVNAGYNLKEAAKLLHICDSTLRNYEKGITVPDLDMARNIEHLYQFPMDYIFLGRNSLKASDCARELSQRDTSKDAS